MRKKILCLAISMIMAVGALTGCGSSSGGISKKVEPTILTEITPGKSTGKDCIKYFDTNGFTYDSDDKKPQKTTNSGLFLGHEYYVGIDYVGESDVVRDYVLEIVFKDVEDYQNGLSEIDDYFKSMSLGVTAIYKSEEDTYHCFLVEDNDDYMTWLMYYPNTYIYKDGDNTEDIDKYYHTTIEAGYYYSDNNIDVWGNRLKWKDSKGNKYTPKYVRNNTSSTDATESTESIKREDSTEISKETNNMSAWKQAYIDYINNSPLNLSDYKYILEDINSDNIPEIFLYGSSTSEREFYYINKNNEVKNIEFPNGYPRADNGYLYIGGGKMGDYYDNVSQCNANGDYISIFDGYWEEDLSGDTVYYKYYIGDNEVSEEEYEGKFSSYQDMTSFGEEDSNQGDVISAIQNY